MIVEYRTGQHEPIVIGRDNGKRKNWDCVIVAKYKDHTETLEFEAIHERAVDIWPYMHKEGKVVFMEWGDPLFVKFRAESK